MRCAFGEAGGWREEWSRRQELNQIDPGKIGDDLGVGIVMVVGSEGLNAFYASKAAHQHQGQGQVEFNRPASTNRRGGNYSEVDAAMSNPYDPIPGGSMQSMASSSDGYVCPCVAKRQSITRTSAIICTCNPYAPRQITISPSVSSTSLAVSAHVNQHHHAFQYHRSHRFGSPATSPLSDASAVVVAASSSHSMDTGMDGGGGCDMMMVGAEDTTMIVDVPSVMVAKRSFGEDGPAGNSMNDAVSGRQTKRLRTDNMGPSAATILCSRAPPSMSHAQRDELCKLLQQSSALGSISYADVVQHFAQRAMWLDSEVTTWLLHVLGQN